MLTGLTVAIVFFAPPEPAPGGQKQARQQVEDPWDSGPPPDPSVPATWNYSGRRTSGFVQKADAQGITLYWPEYRLLIEEFDPRTGAQVSLKEKHFPEVPAKVFALTRDLAKGGYPSQVWSGDTYCITDVKVGDRVCIRFDRRNGVDTCASISIFRRPGGVVPPARGERKTELRRYHEEMNAHQAWEEKRTPYPRGYMPTFLGRDGLLYDSPYPSESRTIVIIPPKAPMPRLVRP